MHLEVVPIQAIRQWQRCLRRNQGVVQRLAQTEHPSLREVEVEVAVVVEVEHRDTGPDHLSEIVLARHPVEVHEVDAHRFGSVAEPLLGGRA